MIKGFLNSGKIRNSGIFGGILVGFNGFLGVWGFWDFGVLGF